MKKNAYLSMVESGDIRYMDDFDKKTHLVQLYEYYKLVDVTNQLLFDTFNDRYFQHIQDNLDLYQATPQPIEVYRQKKFVNSISSYRYFIGTCLTTFERCEGYMEDFLAENRQ
ncbi:MAG: hypothetical protein AAF840_04775 [Bacteroidota bacterium]